MARVLDVSRSGFYAWRRRIGQHTPTQIRRETCNSRVAKAFVENKARYGARRLYHELLAAGWGYNRKTIAASLRRQGQSKTWVLFGKTNNGKLSGEVLYRLVGQGKKLFRWRLPEGNPYLRTEARNTCTSHYPEVAMAFASV